MAAPAAGDRPLKPDGSSSYILLVQHLIEKCLLFNMNQRECVEALSKHANIEPVISITVWNELEKENKDFFSSYFKNMQKNRREEDYCSQSPPEQIMLEDAAGQVHHQRLDQDYSACEVVYALSVRHRSEGDSLPSSLDLISSSLIVELCKS